ncbi:hypothetical protein [Bradyrhizobium sp. F1.13.3]|uniref:hypothetical protein n=1 Tax=Bradyrhizobium sp. F1.13.3 TaxID=3156351 RepID=UPI00339AA6F6
MLNSFQDVPECHAELSKDILVGWLQMLTDQWMTATLLNRTRNIDRFPRSPSEHRSDRAQSRHRLVRPMQYQAMSAGLARIGVA